MLSLDNQQKLEARQIILMRSGNTCRFLKKAGAEGNRIPNFTSSPIIEMDLEGNTLKETTSDCPHMMAYLDKGKYQLTCWDWVPGPGPGDFDLVFENENTMVEFIESYYFGENEYFKARLQYHLKEKSK